MGSIPMAVQLFSVRHDLAEDLRGTMERVAEIGYEGVEFFGPLKPEPGSLRALLDEFNLACCGWHTPFDAVQDDRLEETVAFHKALGNTHVIIPGIPPALTRSRADWLKMAEFFNRLAEKLAPHGMVTGYHNHHVEFTPLDGETPWDTFFGNTTSDVVMQLDTGNALCGGGDCVAILKRYPGRAKTVHLKPYSTTAAKADRMQGYATMIGEDDIPWKEVLALCETTGRTQWYIVEYESDAYPGFEGVKRCLDALGDMGA